MGAFAAFSPVNPGQPLSSRFEPRFFFSSKMSLADAKDAFIIFDEAYEGNDVDCHYLGDILRALGCNVTNAKVLEIGGTATLGEARIVFDDFLPILASVREDLSSTGYKEDYIEGLKVFDKEGNGKVPLAEVLNSLCSLGEKLESKESDKLIELLGIIADEEDMISYMDLIEKLLAATA